MPVQIGSRYQPTYIIATEDGKQYLSRRRRLTLSPSPSDIVYTTLVGDNLWRISGRDSIYGDPSKYWIIADYNNLQNIFGATYGQIDVGTILRIPSIDRVKSFLNGNL